MKVTLEKGAVYHFNFIIETKKKGNHTTQCEIRTDKDRELLAGYGISKCNRADKYDQIMGKVKALNRALRDSGMFSRPERRKHRMKIWRRFFETLQGTDKDLQHMRDKIPPRTMWDNFGWNTKDKKK